MPTILIAVGHLNAGARYLREMLNAKKEADTTYDGPFSHPGEFHAFLAGVGAVLLAVLSGDVQVLVAILELALLGNRARLRLTRGIYVEVKREPWYAVGGMVVTAVVLVVAAYVGAVTITTPIPLIF